VHRWWVLLHVTGVFVFLLAHGVSAYVTFRLPRERDAARVSHLLELSASSVGLMWYGIGILLLGGVLAAFTGHFWGQAWLWVSIGVFAAVLVAMYALGTTWATRLRTISAAIAEGTEAVSTEQFAGILGSRRPYEIAAVGFVGLFVILFLMIFKPTFGLGEAAASACPPSSDGVVSICAVDDQSFVQDTVRAPAGSPFEIRFENTDEGTPHNVAIYTDESAAEGFFSGDLVDGPATVTYDVPALDEGVYFFRCDVHPQMNGTLEAA
jgi:plastocyanin